MSESTVKNIVIIGGSAAGISAADAIVRKNNNFNVTVIYSENQQPYYRPLLSEYLSDADIPEKKNFYLKSREWYKENINLISGTKVKSVSTSDLTVYTDNKGIISFDRLIIATGSSPFIPIDEAVEHKNAFVLRTFADAENIRNYSKSVKKTVIVGGGLLGLEAAFSLMKIGMEVTVIELTERLLPRQLDRETSLFLEDLIKTGGIDVITGVSVERFITEEGRIVSLGLNTGIEISADMVIFSIGTKPNKEIADDILNTDRGIIVNDRMETSVPGIYACGDSVQFNRTPGLWMPAIKQGRIAGDNASDGNSVFVKESYPALLNSFGTRIYSIGNISDGIENLSTRSFGDFLEGNYMKLFFSEGKINGGIIVGNISKSRQLAQCVNNSMDINNSLKLLK